MAMRVATHPLEVADAVWLEHGLDGAGETLRMLVNDAATIERTECIGARPDERAETRRDDAHGFTPKTLLTRLGDVTVPVPHVRDVSVPWGRHLTSCWMCAMRRFVRKAASSMARF